MSRLLFVNLAVADAARSAAFFEGLGFELNADFSTEVTTCVVVNEHTSLLLHEPARFADFATKPAADPTAATEAILAFSAESRDEVDSIADAALANGGSPAGEAQDHGFMYGRSFHDPDGHHWELMWMDLSQAPAE